MEEEKVVLSGRPAELWDSEFDGAVISQPVGFQRYEPSLRWETVKFGTR